jgi:hypothetical protein
MIKNYKPPTSGSQPSTGPSNAQLATLQQKYQQLEQDIKTVDSLQHHTAFLWNSIVRLKILPFMSPTAFVSKSFVSWMSWFTF